MPIPVSSIQAGRIFSRILDPGERLDFKITWTAEINPTGETIEDAELVLSPEAQALGLHIVETQWTETEVLFMLEVNTEDESSFSGGGVTVGIKCRVWDTRPGNNRIYERTFALNIRQQ